MLLGFVILVISGIGHLERGEGLGPTEKKLGKTRGIAEVNSADKFKQKFPETTKIVCKFMHETDLAPFAATILYRDSGRLLCLGTIVDDYHILTAKRCYDKTDANDLWVMVGYYKAYWGKFAQVLPVQKIVRHEYVLALLRLGRKIKFTTYIQAVKLPSAFSKLFGFKKRYPPPYKTIGFPVDRFDVPGDHIGKDKIYGLKLEGDADFDECKANFSKLILDDTKLFCTMPNGTESQPLCWGGWGGPVLKPMSKGFLLQVGVIVADNCSEETTGPLLVVRTDVYGDWIRGNSFRGHQTG